MIEGFEESTGIDVEVRYGSSPEMAATLLTEGADSPADLFYAQDPASLGSVADLMAPAPGVSPFPGAGDLPGSRRPLGGGHGSKPGPGVQP